jgi:hypothetical protein
VPATRLVPLRKAVLSSRHRVLELPTVRGRRLLDEAHASGGDPLRLTHLFGISDPTAIRYCAELDQISPASIGTPADSVNPV